MEIHRGHYRESWNEHRLRLSRHLDKNRSERERVRRLKDGCSDLRRYVHRVGTLTRMHQGLGCSERKCFNCEVVIYDLEKCDGGLFEDLSTQFTGRYELSVLENRDLGVRLELRLLDRVTDNEWANTFLSLKELLVKTYGLAADY